MNFKPLRTFRHLKNLLCPFSYEYTDSNDYPRLIRKINLYFWLNPQKGKLFKEEICFLNEQAIPEKSVTMVWPYPYVLSYQPETIEVFRDEQKDLFYILQNGRKLYYSRPYNTPDAVRASYNSLVVEQNPLSPHLYQKEGFRVEKGDFVVDIGAAEGNFSLDVVETAGRLLIVEAEEHWMEALQATFEPWKEKVTIVRKYISDEDNDRCATLERLIGDNPVDFLKLDVEGAEWSILKSSEKLLRSKQVRKLAVCTYHKHGDEKYFHSMLSEWGFRCEPTSGNMLFVYGKLKPPYFRKVLLQCTTTL